MSPNVVVTGHICLDITPQFTSSELPAPGGLTLVGPAAFSTGGAVSNTGMALRRLGIATRLCAKVGDDRFGQHVLDLLEQQSPGSGEGIRVSPGETTSYSVVLSPADKDRAFLHCPGANQSFGSDDVTTPLLSQADLLHFGYPSIMRRMYANMGQELVEVFRRAKSAGIATSLDLCVIDPDSESGRANWADILSAVLPFVDVFLPSADDLLSVWNLSRDWRDRAEQPPGIAELAALAGRAIAAGARVVVLKAGRRGIYLRSGSRAGEIWSERGGPRDHSAWTCRELWSSPFVPERVETTTGAGDAAVAGFLAALLYGGDPVLALRMACAAGACAVEETDATSGVRSWNETLERVRSGWKQLALEPGAPGWRWDASNCVWWGPNDAR
jgi:sugar/nucleoside kinase (ribokinase family)